MKKSKKLNYIEVDEVRIDEACNAYFKWKDLNTYISNNGRRGINMPDAISEPMGCYCLGLLWNRGEFVGDATDKEQNLKIEMKATSNFFNDLSSFGPTCYFDNLIFLRYNLDNNLLYVHNLQINSEKFGNVFVNKSETVNDQQKQGRRPRLSLYKTFVKAKDLEPDVIFDIRKCKIIKDNRAKSHNLK